MATSKKNTNFPKVTGMINVVGDKVSSIKRIKITKDMTSKDIKIMLFKNGIIGIEDIKENDKEEFREIAKQLGLKEVT